MLITCPSRAASPEYLHTQRRTQISVGRSRHSDHTTQVQDVQFLTGLDRGWAMADKTAQSLAITEGADDQIVA
jgi:capsular polysaccharide biosynthesis protein